VFTRVLHWSLSLSLLYLHNNNFLAVSHHADGIFGPFIVRQSPQRDPNSDLYNYDLDEHVLIVSPWSHKALAYGLNLQEDIEVSSILINGEGTYFVSMFARRSMFYLK
jgi:hypothetical protein